jgi:hypothetical protein
MFWESHAFQGILYGGGGEEGVGGKDPSKKYTLKMGSGNQRDALE